jgi:hypothetical protein
MKQRSAIFLFTLMTVYAFISSLYADDAGTRGAFTRSSYIGSRYISFGRVGEAIADDVFSIYWNPAGLSELSSARSKTPDEIRAKVDKGDVTGITEEDLLSFSENQERFSMQMGVSASRLDIMRQAGFAGVAMSFFHGVIGVGSSAIYSGDIDEYNESGTKTGSGNYTGGVGYLSYGTNFGLSSVGVSVKGLYERLSDAQYSGAALDIGAQAEPLPFIKIGFVAQDIGIGLYPIGGRNLEKKYEFGSPTLRASAAFTSRTSDLMFGVGMVRHIEQNRFEFNAGARYDPVEKVSLSLGFSDGMFSAGAGWRFWQCEAWYSISYDRINMGYNNSISLTVLY